MENITIVLSVIGLIVLFGKILMSRSNQETFQKQWPILDTKFNEILNSQNYKDYSLDEICKALKENNGIERISVIRFFSAHLTPTKRILIEQFISGNKNMEINDVFDYFDYFNTQIINPKDKTTLKITELDERENLFFYSNDIWMYKNNMDKKSNSRGILLITLNNLIFIPRRIESSDFKKLLPLTNSALGFLGDTNILSTGINIYDTADGITEDFKKKTLSENFKKELERKFNTNEGFELKIKNIQRIYFKKTLGVTNLWVVLDNNHFSFQVNKSPFDDSKEIAEFIKLQLELILNLHSRTLMPNNLKKPDSWEVIETDLERIKTYVTNTYG